MRRVGCCESEIVNARAKAKRAKNVNQGIPLVVVVAGSEGAIYVSFRFVVCAPASASASTSTSTLARAEPQLTSFFIVIK